MRSRRRERNLRGGGLDAARALLSRLWAGIFELWRPMVLIAAAVACDSGAACPEVVQPLGSSTASRRSRRRRLRVPLGQLELFPLN